MGPKTQATDVHTVQITSQYYVFLCGPRVYPRLFTMGSELESFPLCYYVD